ncbi:unnamed protein product [Soboliphyme baturini]|uniref:CCT domain-containing protein n=1 Tax=Soboliphyme baturini TaxID=241478 RepID=A0A183IU86_9BILA|nr:unnamed protein product [Soboliphyme baturini]
MLNGRLSLMRRCMEYRADITSPDSPSVARTVTRSKARSRLRFDSGAYSSSTEYVDSPDSDCYRDNDAEVFASSVGGSNNTADSDLIHAFAGRWIVSDDFMSPLRQVDRRRPSRSDDSGLNDCSVIDGSSSPDRFKAGSSFSFVPVSEEVCSSVMKLENPEGALELVFDGSAIASLGQTGLIPIGSPQTAALVRRRIPKLGQKSSVSDFSISYKSEMGVCGNFLMESDENLSPAASSSASTLPPQTPPALHHMMDTNQLTPVKFFGSQTPSKVLPFSPTQVLASTDEFFNGSLAALTSTPLPTSATSASHFRYNDELVVHHCETQSLRRAEDLQSLDTPKEYTCEAAASRNAEWKGTGADSLKALLLRTPTPFKKAYAAVERRGGRIYETELLRSPPDFEDVREIISKDLFMASNNHRRKRHYRFKAKSFCNAEKRQEKKAATPMWLWFPSTGHVCVIQWERGAAHHRHDVTHKPDAHDH